MAHATLHLLANAWGALKYFWAYQSHPLVILFSEAVTDM